MGDPNDGEPPANGDLPHPDLAQLLAELRGARQHTAQILSSRLLVQVRNLARRHLDPHDRLRRVMDSEDLAQDTLMDLIRALDRFRGSTWNEFLAFARALFERRKVEGARHHGARPADLHPQGRLGDVDPPSPSTPTPSEVIAAREEAERLDRLVAELPSIYREALRLRLQGLTYDDIASGMALTNHAVRQRISRALRMLKKRW